MEYLSDCMQMTFKFEYVKQYHLQNINSHPDFHKFLDYSSIHVTGPGDILSVQFWTSGQWMTEKRGGSDVGGATDTIAIQEHGNFYKYVYV